MLIKLLSIQVPQYWDIIKFAIANVDDFEIEDLPAHLNGILHDLLSDKAQCFVKINPEDRKVVTLFVTRIEFEKISDKKYLNIQSIYAFAPSTDEEWLEIAKFLGDFGRNNGCDTMIFRSRQPRAWELGRILGFKENYRSFIYKL